MEYQKFIPEGWQITNEKLDMDTLRDAMQTGKVMQGLVQKCDDNFNLHVRLGENMQGIIPKSEIELSDDIKTSIYKNKENTFVQFKVKSLDDMSNVLLSRKEVKEEALNWVKDDLKIRRCSLWNCKKY